MSSSRLPLIEASAICGSFLDREETASESHQGRSCHDGRLLLKDGLSLPRTAGRART
jgi:hypothetical protein